MFYEKKFTLPVLPPFSLNYTVWALRRSRNNLIDRWDGNRYKRVFVIDGNAVRVLVEQPKETQLLVTTKSAAGLDVQDIVSEKLMTMMGLQKDLGDFYKLAEADKNLRFIMKKFEGLKPPRFPTIFEALVNAIACQQVTLHLGILLLNRLSDKFGDKFLDQHSFPTPTDLSKVSVEELRNLGFSRQKAKAIITLAKGIVDGDVNIDKLENLSDDLVIEDLMKIRGIGRWSSEYVLLRGLGKIDTFPGDDVGAQKNLMLFLGLPNKPDYDQIKKITAKWNPYAGFVYFHLLLDKLQKRNQL